MDGEHVLWYDRPASQWVEALPLGNGRIGAMVWGGVERETLSLNEDTLWSGHPHRAKRSTAKDAIAAAQELVLQGELQAAQERVERDVLGDDAEAYLSLGTLSLAFPNCAGVEAYRRELDLETGVHTVSFTAGGVHYRRECFISYPDQVLVMRVSADSPSSIQCDIALTTPLRSSGSSPMPSEAALYLEAQCPSHKHYYPCDEPFEYSDEPDKRGVELSAVVRAIPSGGSWSVDAEGIHARNADSMLVVFGARTTFCGPLSAPGLGGVDSRADVLRDIACASCQPWEALRSRHEADLAPIMRRCTFRLDAPREEKDTLHRLLGHADGMEDPALYELIFQFGRYLLVSCSRPGSRAANLQGIWNDSMTPPWSSNYTVNINTEMNYWPAEAANLSEMTEPLRQLIRALRVTGSHAAEDFYGARGAVAHHNVDLWAHATPVTGSRSKGAMVWSFWPMGFGWLTRHLWEHWLYTDDRTFLGEEALPTLRDAARFFCDILRDDGTGHLSFFPATSPENYFLYRGSPACGPLHATMSDAIIREVFTNYLAALDALGLQEELAEEVLAKRERLRPYAVGSKGQLLEWTEEYEETEPHHRHQSHLYPLYPGTEIDADAPELMEACRRSLELRGDEGTGWSLGWKICLWARLGDGGHALKLLRRQLRLPRTDSEGTARTGGTYPNLFDAHPPFQIDGNFGAVAGICEMFLRSRPGSIDLLPALPPEWPDGEIRGLRAMGGITVDLCFSGGGLKEATCVADAMPSRPVCVRWGGRELGWITANGTFRYRP